MEKEAQFQISQDHINMRLKLLNAVTLVYGACAFSAVGITAFLAFQMLSATLQGGYGFTWFDLITLIPLALSIGMVAILFFLRAVNRRTISRLKQQRVRLTEDAVQRETHNRCEVISYDDISEIRILRDRKDDLAQLSIRTETQDYILVGLENFGGFLEALKECLFKVRISEQRAWWHFMTADMYNRPLVHLGVCSAIGVAAALLLTQTHPLALNLIQAVFATAIPAFVLTQRPVSNGIVSAKVQRRLATVSLLLGAVMLTLLFF